MRAASALAAQRGHLFPWVPVCLGTGIGLYFALPAEPSAMGWAGVAACALAAALAFWRAGEAWSPLWAALLLLLLGPLLAGARTQMVAAPVLEHRFYGAVGGRIVTLDRAQSDVPRLVLDRVWIEGLAPDETPARVRVSLHGDQPALDPAPGQRVALTAHLSPPPAPAEPGGFDFRRMAWFDRLGAVGYARAPAILIAPPRDGWAMVIGRTRMALSQAIRDRVPGAPGAFAAAILTGDRSAMPQQVIEALRDSNLAHLLAISGLHMGLLTGFVFAALRIGIALVPPLALRVNAKKLAALGALPVAAAYLALSGGNVATQRAFVMVAVMLLAVLADRRALTLRAVALAAVIVLLLRPESVTEAGFQMSFAATTALVGVFRALRGDGGDRPWLPGWARPVLALVISSAVAGAATAPIGAAHFNQVAQYGLLANLATVPLMGTIVIPAAVLALALAPFGLAQAGLEVMRLGIVWILWVAERVAGLDGATWAVVQPARFVLPLLALGMLWVILWQGRARWAGLAPALMALALWPSAPRPALLIAESGGLIGVMTPEGRVLSKPRGDGFAARSWLENDGDSASQQSAWGRAGLEQAVGWTEVSVQGTRYAHVTGRGWAERLPKACAAADVVIAPYRVTDKPPECALIDADSLSDSGALALYDGAGGPRMVGARDRAGARPWSQVTVAQ